MKSLCAIAAVVALAGCTRLEHAAEAFAATPAAASAALPWNTFTLYRTSPLVGQPDRIHVATFDTGHGGVYNHDNCERAAGLFNDQPGIGTRFWCERDTFRP
jgi:hypothetical protein